VHLHYSHIKTAGRANWHRIERMLEMIEEYRRSGVPVTTDVHPYTAGSTTASVLLPPWMLEGGSDAALRRLTDPDIRSRLHHQLMEDTTSWDNWWAFSDGWQGLRLASVPAGSPHARLRGWSMHDVIVEAGVADPVSPAGFDVIWDLLAAERLEVSLISFNNVEANVARFMAQPHCSIGSDALVHPDGHPHPRLYGTFPRVLGRFVRELGALSLPEAVRAMTARAADVIGRPALGRITPGAPADLVLLDPEAVIDRATYEHPRLPPAGIHRVVVAGRTVVRDGALLEAAARPAGQEIAHP
jgi:N-acyl-D-amino-acid deacylase